MDVTVSVIIPAWRAADTLEPCVASVLAQDANLELIIVDDGSPDRTPHVADQIADTDRRVHVIHAEHGGRCAARNHGIDAAHGTWVVFVDADDIMPDDALTALLDHAGDADIVWGNYCDDRGTAPRCSGAVGLLDAATANRLTANIEAFDVVPRGFAFDTWNTRTVTGKAYRRRLLVGVGGIRFVRGLRFGEDCLFNLEATSQAGGIRYVDAPVYRHQHRLSQTVAVYRPEDFDSVALLARTVMGLDPVALAVRDGDLQAFVAREWLNTFARGARYAPLSEMRPVCAAARRSLTTYVDGALSWYPSRGHIRRTYNTLRIRLVRWGCWRSAFLLQRIAGGQRRGGTSFTATNDA